MSYKIEKTLSSVYLEEAIEAIRHLIGTAVSEGWEDDCDFKMETTESALAHWRRLAEVKVERHVEEGPLGVVRYSVDGHPYAYRTGKLIWPEGSSSSVAHDRMWSLLACILAAATDAEEAP